MITTRQTHRGCKFVKGPPAHACRPDQWYSLLRIEKGLSTSSRNRCIKNEPPISSTGRRSIGRLGKSLNRLTTLSAEGRVVGSWFQQSRIRSSTSGVKPRCRLKSSSGRDGLSPDWRRCSNLLIPTPSNGIFPENI